MIDYVFIIVITTLFLEVFICLYALKRNTWILNQRIKILNESIEAYDKLPSYHEMLFGHGFWRWDINYYINKQKI